ncbi:hypothetical protein HOY80DRAFT_967458 [Tuber brumale]|nr:hypothetical protein HOY80DRAFT_967458 [Tuber brumale]
MREMLCSQKNFFLLSFFFLVETGIPGCGFYHSRAHQPVPVAENRGLETGEGKEGRSRSIEAGCAGGTRAAFDSD